MQAQIETKPVNGVYELYVNGIYISALGTKDNAIEIALRLQFALTPSNEATHEPQ